MATVTQLVDAAHQHIANANFDDAAELLRQALLRSPSSLKAMKAYAGCLLAQGDLTAAISMFRRCVDINPEDTEALHDLGMAHHANGNTEDALAHLERAVLLDPENTEFHAGIGSVLAELGDVDKSLAHLVMALSLDPDQSAILANIGMVLLKIGAVFDAKDYLDRAIAADPENRGAKILLATILNDVGQSAEALNVIEPLYFAHPRDPQVASILAATLARVGRIDEALPIAHGGLKLAPEYLPCIEAFAFVSACAGDPESGIKAIAQQLRQTSEREIGYLIMAQALGQVGKHEEAILSARRAMTSPRISVLARELIGKNLAILGRFSETIDGPNSEARKNGETASGPKATAESGNAGEAASFDNKATVIALEARPLDVLLLARFLRNHDMKAQGTPVYAPDQIHPILARIVDKDRLLPLDDLPEEADANDFEPFNAITDRHDPLTAPAYVPYMHADPARDDLWAEVLGDLPRPLIGITWNRYTPEASLFDVRNAVKDLGGTIISLVWDEDMREELDGVGGIIDGGYHFMSLEAAIDLIDKLDVVVGPDTLQLHMAGALGRPAVALLPPNKAWYWFAPDAMSHWYPTMRCVERTWQVPWSDMGPQLTDAVRERLDK